MIQTLDANTWIVQEVRGLFPQSQFIDMPTSSIHSIIHVNTFLRYHYFGKATWQCKNIT